MQPIHATKQKQLVKMSTLFGIERRRKRRAEKKAAASTSRPPPPLEPEPEPVPTPYGREPNNGEKGFTGYSNNETSNYSSNTIRRRHSKPLRSGWITEATPLTNTDEDQCFIM